MVFALKLFRISLYNTYYQDRICNDFSLAPDEITQHWMQRYPMRLTAHPGNFELIWLTAGLTDPLQLFQKKMHDKQLSFYLFLQNPRSIAHTALSIEKGKIYYFTNEYGGTKLHKKKYVTPNDKIPVKSTMLGSQKIEKAHFGKIAIHLNTLYKSPHFTESNVPVQYTIQMKAK